VWVGVFAVLLPLSQVHPVPVLEVGVLPPAPEDPHPLREIRDVKIKNENVVLWNRIAPTFIAQKDSVEFVPTNVRSQCTNA
jgi:hypothetical protein